MPEPVAHTFQAYPHVVHRGVERRPVFFADADYSRFLSRLGEARAGTAWPSTRTFDDEHTHVLMTPESASSISELMRFLGGAYVPEVNKRLERSGHLWEVGTTRVSSQTLAASRLLPLHEMNPVRAGLCRHPGAYRWSSHRRNALGAPNTLITPHDEYQTLSTSEAGRLNAYAQLFEPEALGAALRPTKPLTFVRESSSEQPEGLTPSQVQGTAELRYEAEQRV